MNEEKLQDWIATQDDAIQIRIVEILLELKQLYGDSLHSEEYGCGFCDELHWAEDEINGKNPTLD